MGTLLAGLLARAGEEVTLLDYKPERAAQLAEFGLTVKTPEGDFSVPIRATADASEAGFADVILVCVKAFQTVAAAEHALPCVSRATTLLTLQNGLGNLEALSEIFGAERVIGGVTAHGATMAEPGKVIHTGVGETVIGEQTGKITARLEEIQLALNNAGISTSVTLNLPSAIWGKLVLNCAINPLAALTRLRNGDLLKEPALADLLVNVAKEAASVAKASGIKLPYNKPAEQVIKLCQLTAGNINSMLADVLSRRPTEINQINGAVARAAAAAGLPAPLNEALTAIVSGIEAEYDRQVR